jgi:hypothetical protein
MKKPRRVFRSQTMDPRIESLNITILFPERHAREGTVMGGAGKFVEGETGEGREARAIESLPAVQ